MPTVNPQITDAVTQSNVKVVAEAPALALGTIYQALAHATGLAFENAVSAQQQRNLIAQAATATGVAHIYSAHPTSDVATAEKIVEETRLAGAQLAAAAPTADVGDAVSQAVRTTLASVLSHSGDVAYGTRAAADALAAALHALGRENYEGHLRIVQLAGITACVAGIARAPNDAAAYASAIETIKKL